MGAKPGQSGKSAGRQRLALVMFAALFVIVFAGFAIVQGIGQPSVPSGDVAIVQHVPDGNVSEAELKRALLQQAAQGELKKLPKPGEKKYEELKTAALKELLQSIWISGEAEELGIEVTPKQVATELAQIKKQNNFNTEAAFQKFLKTSHLTRAEVNDRVELQLVGTQIQEKITQETPPPSKAEIADYYNSAKATQYTTPESRDVRIVVSKKKGDVEKAKVALEKDDSDASWKKVAAKYSEDPATKTKGGLQPALNEKLLQGSGELQDAIFDSPTGQIVGLVSYENNYFVIEVEKLNPEKVKNLEEVSSEISSQLTQTVSQEIFSEFLSDFQSKWHSRTYCASDVLAGASDFLAEVCANFVGSGHPSSAPPACYEADPKGGTPKECPAPVAQLAPALPGTTTLLKPQGERLPQRARPEGLKEAGEEGLGLPEGATPGATPGATEVPPPTGE